MSFSSSCPPRSPCTDAQLYAGLASIFGYAHFRPHQQEVVRAVLSGRDSFTIMPTGGGKSLCYQLPAHLMAGTCVVVSPLISLMKDQVDAACANGLRAATLNSASTAADRQHIHRALRENTLDLLYVSPERLNAPGFWDYLKSVNVAFFAIDEAHCISQWGHDFRPDYLALSDIGTHFPHTPMAAFTATATPQVAQDIADRLGLRDPLRVCASFNRPNLFYQIVPKDNANAQILAYLEQHPGDSGVIYRTTRKNVDDTAAFLQSKGITAKAYHAGLADTERARTQEEFRQDICPVIVATVAFGMGIDKSNVRFVIHADLPKNMEGYYQETGRAGRDGEAAHCLLLYDQRDIAQLLRFAHNNDDAAQRDLAVAQVYTMVNFTQKDCCRRKTLLAYFGEIFGEDNCATCDICTGQVQREEATLGAQKALSAMVRSGNRFGTVHLIDILMGAKTQRIRDTGHDQLPTYGVGKDKSRPYWRRILDALVLRGLAEIADPDFPVLHITDAGWKVLRGQDSFSILLQVDKVRQRKSRPGKEEAALAGGYDSALFEALRAERTRLARQANLPPYLVFHDTALREMASLCPASEAEMLHITGVGEKKLANYGAAFLAVIAAHKMAQ